MSTPTKYLCQHKEEMKTIDQGARVRNNASYEEMDHNANKNAIVSCQPSNMVQGNVSTYIEEVDDGTPPTRVQVASSSKKIIIIRG